MHALFFFTVREDIGRHDVSSCYVCWSGHICPYDSPLGSLFFPWDKAGYMYAPEWLMTAVIPCPAGWRCSSNKLKYICDAGQYRDPTMLTCANCPPNTWGIRKGMTECFCKFLF